MERNSIWKKVLLLSLTTVFALHIQVASAQEDTETVKTSNETEECVITEDQL